MARPKKPALRPAQLEQLLEKEAQPILSLLRPYSYMPTSLVTKPTNLGPMTTLILESAAARRRINIGLSWVDGKAGLDILISRLPRQGERDDMALYRFARRHISGLEDSDFQVDGAKPLREEVGRLLKLYAKILARDALPIVTGEKWEEGLIYQRV